MRGVTIAAVAIALAAAGAFVSAQQPPAQGENPQAFRFRTGVELVNVTATVTDGSGRFVDGLRQEDFRVYDNDRQQTITHFSNERVPVSLGIVLDTSGSMDGEKMRAARRALDRFLFDLLDPADEVFLYRFDSEPQLVEGWTSDKRKISDALSGIRPRGGTALYDSVAAAIPLAQNGRHRKKALVIISDGNDTSSSTDVRALQQLIRQTEVLVYAIGIDGRAEGSYTRQVFPQPPPRRPRPPIPLPFPMPGGRPPSPLPPQPRGPVGGGRWQPGPEDRVNVAALRDITDDSGGRTEIIRDAKDLDPATAGIADELSRQYYIGYPAPGEHDGQWHTIRVDVRGSYHVRARRGYVASR
jgi:VWFA-related protein